MNKHNILVLYQSISNATGTVVEYLQSFKRYSRYNVYYMDCTVEMQLNFPLKPFDGIIIFYSVAFGFRFTGFSSPLARQIASYSGAKICIIQDEYDSVNNTCEALAGMKIDALVTVMQRKEARKIYGIASLRHMELLYELTGYITDEDIGKKCRPLNERPLVLGYRGRPARFYYGTLGMEKTEIGVRMKAICQERGVTADIEVDEDSRIYGPDWPNFLQSCRAVLGVESGSSVFDFDGTLPMKINSYIASNPDTTFQTIRDLFLRDLEGNLVVNTVSPRIFEAILNRTGLVLYEGEYAGVVQPWLHYIPLKKDYSNIDAVLAAVMDDDLLQNMIDRAYEDVVLSKKYSYKTFIQRIDNCLERLMSKDPKSDIYFRMYGYCSSGSGEDMGDVQRLDACTSFEDYCSTNAVASNSSSQLLQRYSEKNLYDIPSTCYKATTSRVPSSKYQGFYPLLAGMGGAVAPEADAGIRAMGWN